MIDRARELAVPGGEVVLAIDMPPDAARAALPEARRVAASHDRYPIVYTHVEPIQSAVLWSSAWTPGQAVARASELTIEDARRFAWHAESGPPAAGGHGRRLTAEREASRIERAYESTLIDSPEWEWEDSALLLLPTTDPAHAGAYVGPHTTWEGAAPFVVVLDHWRTRFGAEVVAATPISLRFRVARPPQDLAAAMELAAEQAMVAECTRIDPGLSLRELARCLVGRSDWVISERP